MQKKEKKNSKNNLKGSQQTPKELRFALRHNPFPEGSNYTRTATAVDVNRVGMKQQMSRRQM